jgi:hypothetical protein
MNCCANQHVADEVLIVGAGIAASAPSCWYLMFAICDFDAVALRAVIRRASASHNAPHNHLASRDGDGRR